MTEYSEDLINKIIKYYKDKHKHIIDRGTAIIYLNNLAGLFSAFAEISINNTQK